MIEGAGIGFLIGVVAPALMAQEFGFDLSIPPLLTGIIGAVIGGIIGGGMQGGGIRLER
jgi:uncharacterized membrane protein YeaQ/YmgE (transglycosylase-associated protein family)